MANLTELEKTILSAVELGAIKAHIKYLPEVLALVNKGMLNLTGQDERTLYVQLPESDSI